MKAPSNHCWRYLVSKIHPQLPLNPRDSQKLLGLLQTSFSEQLDREHPVAMSERRNATDDHLQSILQSPLFEVGPEKRRLSHPDRRNSNPRGQVWEFLERPMEYFKERIVAGTADLDVAILCLTVQHKKLLASSNASKTSIKPSDTGTIILSWLWSSGLTESISVRKHHEFIKLLTPFLVIEGHGNQIWRWLMQPEPSFDSTSPVRPYILWQRHALFMMIKSEVKHGDGWISSSNMFMQILGKVRSTEQIEYVHRGLFGKAGSYLCFKLIQAPNEIKVEEYDKFYQAVASWSNQPFFHHGFLELYHPQEPIATSALHYLREWTPGKEYRRRTVQLALKAAEVLMSKDLREDAWWIMDFLKSEFGKDLDRSSASADSGKDTFQQETVIAQEEEISLRSLEALESH